MKVPQSKASFTKLIKWLSFINSSAGNSPIEPINEGNIKKGYNITVKIKGTSNQWEHGHIVQIHKPCRQNKNLLLRLQNFKSISLDENISGILITITATTWLFECLKTIPVLGLLQLLILCDHQPLHTTVLSSVTIEPNLLLSSSELQKTA